MSAAEFRVFARKRGEITVSLHLTAADNGGQPRPFAIATRLVEDGGWGMFSGHLSPDEARAVAGLLWDMAARCDLANAALARGDSAPRE